MAADQGRIIVVGAGLAGLAAASKLQEEGYTVLVLEARDRIGGRVWTDRSAGSPMDMGASWIHGVRNNPITKLAREAGAELSEKFDYDHSITYDADGSESALTDKRLRRYYRVLQRHLEQALDSKPLSSVQSVVNAAKLRGEFDFLSDRQLDFLINSEVEHEFGAIADQLTVFALDEGEEYRGGDVLFADGYDHIVGHLSQGLEIRTRTPVVAIEYHEDGVVATGGDERLTADRVLITVPLGVLKAKLIHFDPPLPHWKRVAINEMGMGVLNKVWLKFPAVFWQRDADLDLIQYISEDKGHFAEWVNAYKFTGEPLLLTFNAGEYGAAIEAKSDSAIVNEAMAVLRRIYGDSIPEPSQARITRWLSDPFAKGSYSYLRVGASPDHRKALAAPVDDRVFFAGEATSTDYPATTQGAYWSGLREARRIMRSLPEE